VQRPSEVSLTTVSQERFGYVITAYGINGQIILHQKNRTSVKWPCMFVRKAITNSPIRTLCWNMDIPLVALGTE